LIPDRREPLRPFAVAERLDDCAVTNPHKVGPRGRTPFAVPSELESSDGHLRLMTTSTSFATATDVTLAELHLEAFLPADDGTADVLRRRASRW